MKSFYIFLFLLGCGSLYAQQTEKYWYPGEVHLIDGTEIKGDINYNLRYHLIRVRINGKTTVLREEQLTSLVLFTEDNRYEFRQVALKNERGEVSLTFAKLIYLSQENFSLFKEYFVQTRTVDIDPLSGAPTIRDVPADHIRDAFSPNPKPGPDYRLFLADYQGNRYPISGRGFSKAFGKRHKKIKKYMAQNELSIGKEEQLIKIIRYADILMNEGSND